MAIARRNLEVHRTAPSDRPLLHDLEEAHERLFSEIANMDELTLRTDPDWSTFFRARWRISEASLTRRTLAARAIDNLLTRARGDEVGLLKSLKASDQEMLRLSARHVQEWPLSAIQKDWAGYCVASRVIRKHMIAFLNSEQQALFPMLKGTGSSDSMPSLR